MRIDDRKVNGRISIDATDIVEGFNIAILENDPSRVMQRPRPTSHLTSEH